MPHCRLARVAQWVHRKQGMVGRLDWLVVDDPLVWRGHEHRYLSKPRDRAAQAVIIGKIAEVDDPQFYIATTLTGPFESCLCVALPGNDDAFADTDIVQRRKKRLDVTHIQFSVVVLAVKRDRDVETGYQLLNKDIDLAEGVGALPAQRSVPLTVRFREMIPKQVTTINLIMHTSESLQSRYYHVD